MSRRPRSPTCVEFTGQAATRSACRSASVTAVTAHAAEYVDTWTTANDSERRRPALARVLLAASRGHARVPTCEHILRRVHTYIHNLGQEAAGAAPLLRRVLSLFGPGELQALNVADTGSIQLVQAMLTREAHHGLATLSRALHSLRAIRCRVCWRSEGTAALIDRYAATITQLECMPDLAGGAADRALARCRRMEFLARAGIFQPSAWLQLSQLHTLHGVSLVDVPVAAMVAALPRLHTLHAINERQGHGFAVAEFLDKLLPRLQSFHFFGWWPEEERDATTPPPPPLPSLLDMVWKRVWQPMALPRGFMGAQPVSLHVDLPAIAEGLTTSEATTRPGSTAKGLLARVRDLQIAGVPDLAPLLRAAPGLRRLTLRIRGEDLPLWLTAREPAADPAFTEIVHRRLRHLIVDSGTWRQVAADCAFVLQQRHFPRLRRLTIDNQEYPVSMTE